MKYHILKYDPQIEHWFVVFYGYGQHANRYLKLAELVQSHSNFLVIDLPYFKDDSMFCKDSFFDFIKSIFQKYQIQSISILGFSLGARYAFVLCEQKTIPIQNVFWIAPDGIRTNIVYQIATSTMLGKYLFEKTIIHSNFFNTFFHFLKSIHLLPNDRYQFLMRNIQHKNDRYKLYYCWLNMKNMKPDFQHINANLSSQKSNIVAYFGRYDFIIKMDLAGKLKKMIPNAQIHILEDGHRILNDSLFHKIAQYFQ